MNASESDTHVISMRKRLLCGLVGLVGAWVIRCYFWFVHIRDNPAARRHRLGGPTGKPVVYAFWHAHQLACVHHWRNCGVHILVSRHTDGEMIARTARRMGFAPVRGSSTRGAMAGLKGLLAALERGCEVGVTPDGPRGPRHRVKMGTIYLAQRTGAPIVPVVIGFSRVWELASWDRFRIPKPFSRGTAMMGTPLHVPADADEATLQRFKRRLEKAINDLEAEADIMVNAECGMMNAE